MVGSLHQQPSQQKAARKGGKGYFLIQKEKIIPLPAKKRKYYFYGCAVMPPLKVLKAFVGWAPSQDVLRWIWTDHSLLAQ